VYTGPENVPFIQVLLVGLFKKQFDYILTVTATHTAVCQPLNDDSSPSNNVVGIQMSNKSTQNHPASAATYITMQ
jgi:hypothetical protein